MAKKRASKAATTAEHAKPNGEKPPPYYAFRELARELANVLHWAVEPWPSPLPENWLDGQTRTIRQAARTARNATTDRRLVNKIFAANGQGVEFAQLLQKHPAISMVSVEHWTVPRYRQLFDDVSAMQVYFRQIADELEASALVDKQSLGDPTRQQIARVRAAINAVGKSASPKLVMNAMKADNTNNSGMKEQTFRKCLQLLTERGEFSGNQRTRAAKG